MVSQFTTRCRSRVFHGERCTNPFQTHIHFCVSEQKKRTRKSSSGKLPEAYACAITSHVEGVPSPSWGDGIPKSQDLWQDQCIPLAGLVTGMGTPWKGQVTRDWKETCDQGVGCPISRCGLKNKLKNITSRRTSWKRNTWNWIYFAGTTTKMFPQV